MCLSIAAPAQRLYISSFVSCLLSCPSPFVLHRRKALKYIEIVRTSHLALAVASMDGRLLLCNEKFCKVTGMSGSCDPAAQFHPPPLATCHKKGPPKVSTVPQSVIRCSPPSFLFRPWWCTGHSNDKLNGATIFSLAAFDALEEIFAAFARLLSAAHVTEEANPAFFSTATCKAAPMSGEPVRTCPFQTLCRWGWNLCGMSCAVPSIMDCLCVVWTCRATRHQPSCYR